MIAHTRRGSGPPLVLIHALGADRRMWDPVIDRLAAHRDVIAIDMPGFGESPPLGAVAREAARGGAAGRAADARGGTSAPVSPHDLARAVRAHSLALGLDRPHVAGNSLGGWVALELALAGHAQSVTAIAPAGLWAQPLVPKRSQARVLARALRPVLPALLRSARGRRVALGSTIAHPERVPYSAALALVRGYADAPGFEAVNAGMRAGRFTGLAEIPVPLTLAWPEHDGLVARPRDVPAAAREVFLARLRPHADVGRPRAGRRRPARGLSVARAVRRDRERTHLATADLRRQAVEQVRRPADVRGLEHERPFVAVRRRVAVQVREPSQLGIELAHAVQRVADAQPALGDPSGRGDRDPLDPASCRHTPARRRSRL